ncbi:MAG: universal stress protein [Rhodocyclaceae bacterium]|jgi:nucleotide-binding universal stress UspA family protein|nr:universal stress protein [Rhodocyclaceae bacterium]
MKILLPVDGSEHAVRAARHVVASVHSCTDYRILLLNVQEPIDAPEIRSHMRASEIEAMQETRGGDAMAPVREVLDKAGLAYTPTVLIGPIAETIAKFAAEQGCEKIVMGTRGLGAVAGVLMGSVTTRLLSLTTLPVTLVK